MNKNNPHTSLIIILLIGIILVQLVFPKTEVIEKCEIKIDDRDVLLTSGDQVVINESTGEYTLYLTRTISKSKSNTFDFIIPVAVISAILVAIYHWVKRLDALERRNEK